MLPPIAQLTELQHLGKCREALAALLKSASPQRPLSLVIGNGAHGWERRPGSDIYGTEYKKRSTAVDLLTPPPNRNLSAEERDQLLWHYNEALRILSLRHPPRPSVAYLLYLVRAGLANLILTPNYDLFIEGCLRRLNLAYSINREPRLSSEAQILKYHGTSEQVIFEPCTCKRLLPDFAVMPFEFPRATNRTALDQLDPNAGQRRHLHLASRGGGQHFANRVAHWIDYNFDHDRSLRRKYFGAAIDRATAAISKLTPKNSAGILAVGFGGRFDTSNADNPANEEIVPELCNAIDRGVQTSIVVRHDHDYELLENHLAAHAYAAAATNLVLDDAVETFTKVLPHAGLGRALEFYDALVRLPSYEAVTQ